MRRQNLIFTAGAFLAVMLFAGTASAEDANGRYGRWKIKSDAPAPQSNIMTYAPFGMNGMKITIDQVNKDGKATQWGYTTDFSGKDEKTFFGDTNNDTGAVKMLSPTVNEIIYKNHGKITQILTNVLSVDGKTIGVMYMRYNADGKCTGVTTATYEKIE
jgi:hypothetical protein